MNDGHEVGPDVDLDAEDVRDRQGRRVTEAYAEQAAAEALQLARPGRPALGEVGRHSPRVSFRVPEQVRRQAEQRAVDEGRSVSEIARDALERYLLDVDKDRHVVPDPNGGWKVEKPGASRASSHHDTQKDATAQARRTVARTGGDTIVHGKDGQIRHRDTAKGGNDPNPPRDNK